MRTRCTRMSALAHLLAHDRQQHHLLCRRQHAQLAQQLIHKELALVRRVGWVLVAPIEPLDAGGR